MVLTRNAKRRYGEMAETEMANHNRREIFNNVLNHQSSANNSLNQKQKEQFMVNVLDDLSRETHRQMDTNLNNLDLHPLYYVTPDNILSNDTDPTDISFLPRLRFDLWFDYLKRTNSTELFEISTYIWTQMIARCMVNVPDENKKQIKKQILIAHYVLVKSAKWICDFNSCVSHYYPEPISDIVNHLNPVSKMIEIMNKLSPNDIVELVNYVEQRNQ